ncbi:hypothetical protein K438DRAFT_1994177 [Mycena galopus ATCC 62051]|nr:hypothetical protein K438DRAFT_1994177 [Mycena galopus ATCC 62051]
MRVGRASCTPHFYVSDKFDSFKSHDQGPQCFYFVAQDGEKAGIYSLKSAAESHLPAQGKFEIMQCKTIYEALHQPQCLILKMNTWSPPPHPVVPTAALSQLSPLGTIVMKTVDIIAGIISFSSLIVKKGGGFKFTSVDSTLVKRGASSTVKHEPRSVKREATSVKHGTSTTPKRRRVKRTDSPDTSYTLPLYRDDTPPPDSTPPVGPVPSHLGSMGPILSASVTSESSLSDSSTSSAASSASRVRSTATKPMATNNPCRSPSLGAQVIEIDDSPVSANEYRATTPTTPACPRRRQHQLLEIEGLGKGGPLLRRRAPPRFVPALVPSTTQAPASNVPSASKRRTSPAAAVRPAARPASRAPALLPPASQAPPTNADAASRGASYAPSLPGAASSGLRAPAPFTPTLRTVALGSRTPTSRTAASGSHASHAAAPLVCPPTQHLSTSGASPGDLGSSHSAAPGGSEFFYNKFSKMIYKDMELIMDEMGDYEAVTVVNSVQEMRAAISSGGVLSTGRKGKGKAPQEDARGNRILKREG